MDQTEGRRAMWDRYAGVNPFWAVIATSKWEDREAFFKTGEGDMERILAPLENSGMLRFPIGRAIEFGCGVGRLLRPLSKKAREVVGVDISPVMLEQARTLPGSPTNATFAQSGEDGTIPLPDNQFDLALSNEVFVHTPQEVVLKAISEMLRVLRPGGVLVFNCPTAYLLLLVGSRTGSRMMLADEFHMEIKTPAGLTAKCRMLGTIEERGVVTFDTEGVRFPMHSTPREDILLAIEKGGARLVFSRLSNYEEIVNEKWSYKPLVHTFYAVKRADSGGPLGDRTV